MSKIRHRYLAITALGVLLTWSSDPCQAGDGSGWGVITQLSTFSTGDMVRIEFSEPVKNPENCENAEFYMRELDESAGSSRFLAILMSAFLERKRVNFYIAGCTERKWWGHTRPAIQEIYVR